MAAAWGPGAALLAGLLLPGAFAPLGMAPLSIVSLTILFLTWFRSTPRQAAWRGWLFGVGLFSAGVYWVYFSMHDHAHMPAVMALVFTGVLAVLLALVPALSGYVAARAARPALPAVALIAAFPATWALGEWLRGWLLTGFPWLHVGYPQVDSALGALAPVSGIHGVSWASAVSAGLLALALERGLSRRWTAVGAALGALAVLWGAAWGVGQLKWTQPAGSPLDVTLIQGNVPQQRKWNPRYRTDILDQYARLTRRHWDSDIVIWPETAVPVFYDLVEDNFIAAIAYEAREHDTDIVLGIPARDPDSGRYYNSVMTLGGDRAFYHKRHLVPFGEYIPLRGVFNDLLDILQVPMSSFTPGSPAQAPLQAGGHHFGTAICYEIAFGGEIIQALPQAAFLVTVSNNTWFGDSSAPHQILEMARMRALETGRFVLSATNDGMTAIIDANGRVRARAPQFERAVLTGSVVPRQGATPYVLMGNTPVVAAMLGVLLAAWVWAARARIRINARARTGQSTAGTE